MNNLKLLNTINSPDDLKKLDVRQLERLCSEIRSVLIETVSKNGGHLASNLGVVELTVAMHTVFESPKDAFVWDVGHQVYTHKILTGRLSRFESIRKEGGLSGFSRPNESEHDIFYSGHSSTSIAAAQGLASAKSLEHDNHSVVAVIGDGALTGGLAYEALNNAGRSKDKLIVILNDNKMSISKNVGAMARYLAKMRLKPGYFRLKAKVERFLKHIPVIGVSLSNGVFASKKRLKNLLYNSTLFEDMGFHYMGPVDGHDIKQLTEALEGAKEIKKPVFLHVITTKGKGYLYAEERPKEFHGISKFDIETGDPVHSGESYSDKFGEYLCEFAEKDDKICAITAAMTLGTGLSNFSRLYKNRFFDVGIAEEYAVTFASGLSKSGMRPVFAVYSTFLQRCYDQIIHDAALQKGNIVLAIDRAGFVGEDGESHQGVYDVSFLNSIPDVRIYSPSSFHELRACLCGALYKDDCVSAVRYPRGKQRDIPEDYHYDHCDFTVYGEEAAEVAVITYGRIFACAANALHRLKKSGINIKVIKLNLIKPVAQGAVDAALRCKHLFFFEEGVRTGGVGEHFAAMLLEQGYKGTFVNTAVEDCFIRQASVARQLQLYRLDEDAMVEIVSGGVGNGR